MNTGTRDQSSLPLLLGIAWRMGLVTFVTLGVLGTGIGLLSGYERARERELHRSQSLQRTEVAGSFLASQLTAVKSDLLYLARQAALQDFLTDFTTRRGELEQEYALFAETKQVYDQIRVLDLEGQEVVRVNRKPAGVEVIAQDALQSKSDRYYFQEAMRLARNEVFVSDLDLNVEHGKLELPLKPVLRLLTPVFDRTGTRRGLLALNCLAAEWLGRLETSRSPGALLLVDSAGHYVRGRHPEDAWGGLLGSDINMSLHAPRTWPRILHDAPIQLETPEGLFTVGVFDPRPGGTGWTNAGGVETPALSPRADGFPREGLFVIVHLDRDEMFAGSRRLMRRLFSIAGLALLVALGIAFFWARAAALHEAQVERIAQSERRLRLLSAELFSAQETERRAISREIHDELGQQATAIQLNLRRAERQTEPEQVRATLGTAAEGMAGLLQAMHDMASRVRLTVLDDFGLGDALRSTLDEFQTRTGMRVSVELDPELNRVPARIGEHVFRVVQEALVNVARHAEAKALNVHVGWKGTHLEGKIIDNGVGFRVDESLGKGRLGMLGMRERVELLEGEFRVETRPGEGTRVAFRIPVPGATPASEKGIET